MVYCNNCGLSADLNARFCIRCGIKLDVHSSGWRIRTRLNFSGLGRQARHALKHSERMEVRNVQSSWEGKSLEDYVGLVQAGIPIGEDATAISLPLLTPLQTQKMQIKSQLHTSSSNTESGRESPARDSKTSPLPLPKNEVVPSESTINEHDVNRRIPRHVVKQPQDKAAVEEVTPLTEDPNPNQNRNTSAVNHSNFTKPLTDVGRSHAEALTSVRKNVLKWRLVIVASVCLLAIGSITLVESVTLSSSTLAFIGLGLTFWGLLIMFLRPVSYARAELVDSTALSSIQAVDRIISDMGYHGRGIYLPRKGTEWVALFVPADKDSSNAPRELNEDSVIQSNPKGISFVPPGLELAKFFLDKLGKGRD